MCFRKLWPAMALAVLTLTGCGLFSSAQEGGSGEPQVGQAVSTAWFDYTVTQVRTAGSFQGRAAGEDCQLLVLDLRLENRYDQPVPMYDTDFQLYWGDYGDDQWALPLEAYCQEQLPGQYQLEVGERREGVLVYQVPLEVSQFTLAFLEVFDTGTGEGEEGEVYLLPFSVEPSPEASDR